MKKEILFLAALATCLSSFGQTFEKTAQGGKFQTAQPTLNGEVIFYSPSIVRIVKYPSAEMPEKKSYPVIKTPEKVEISYKQNGNTVCMTSGKMTVTLDVVTGKVTYTDLKGETLLKEKVEGTNFIPRKDVNSLTSGPEFTQRLQKLVHLYLNTDCGFILSGLFSSCSQFLHMVSLLPETGQLILYHGFGAIIDENEYTGFIDKPLNPAPLIQKLRQYIDQDDFAGCRTALKRLTAQLASRKYHPRQTILLLKKTFEFFLLYETIRLSSDPAKTAETRREFLHCCTLKEYLGCFGRLFDLLALSPLTLKISDSSCRREVLLICDYIEKNIDHRITLSMLSENVNMSENYISRLFKTETGNNIVNYINQLKMNHARPLLEDKNLSVRDVALALGFDEPSYFNKLFFRFFGLSPTVYRKAVTEILNAE